LAGVSALLVFQVSRATIEKINPHPPTKKMAGSGPVADPLVVEAARGRVKRSKLK
jgi:hypothetical protein